jgi:membrane fusion protein, heavy metal efflux system
MSSKHRNAEWVLVALLFATLMLSGCHAAAKHTEAAQQFSEKTGDPLQIRPAPPLREQLKVGSPQTEEIAGTLRVSGRVEANERHLARVGSPVSGRITALLSFEGERVRKGQVIAKLHSTQLSDAQFAFLKAHSQLGLAKRAAERAQQLLAANVIGNAEVQRRQAELDQASAELSSMRAQLQVLGMTDEAIANLQAKRVLDAEFPVIATISGTVLERKVTIGQIVQPADVAFLIADLSSVWLVAEIPEQNAGHLAAGKQLEAEIPALPGEIVRGRLSFVSSIVNSQTGTVTARMDVPNPNGLLKPAMLATVVLKDQAHAARLVPNGAIVREQNQDHVFVAQPGGVFALRKVKLGEEFGDARVLKDGVKPGEQIVCTGAFHLNNERKRMLLEGGA